MKNIQIILNAILSKNIFEYFLVDRDLRILQFSTGIEKYLSSVPKEGDSALEHLPELVGNEEEVKKIFAKRYCLYTLESVYKNEYFVNITIEYCDKDTAIILLHNITAITLTKQNLLQYSNESSLLYNALQKVIDNQNALLFVTDDTHIEFANKQFMEYFKIPDDNALKESDVSIYKHYSTALDDYSDLFALTKDAEKHIKIGSDTFLLKSTLIESTHKLFTLTKITTLSNEIALDPLTGIYRKGFLDEALAHYIATQRKFGLVVLDIDNFKLVNDTFGHLTGDQVLRDFATLIKRNIRKNDLFARWGGEEFILLFEEDAVEDIITKTEKIRRFIESNHFEGVSHLAASFGIAYVDTYDTVETIFSRADKALYKAKRNGKNQVVFESC